MTAAYLNYPQARIRIHHNPECIQLNRTGKINQRIIRITPSNIQQELENFQNHIYRFTSTSEFNDMWIYVELESATSEEAVVGGIRKLLAMAYARFAKAEIRVHCTSKSESSNIPAHIEAPEQGRKQESLSQEARINAILDTITNRIEIINSRYRSGPSLYFYKRILALRKLNPTIRSFASDLYSIEILYATLVSWDMDSRGAKLKDFDSFRAALLSCLPEFEEIEVRLRDTPRSKFEIFLEPLMHLYSKLELMKTSGRLVSNSKCLHFLFPSLCMPMDKTNTLQYLYSNTYESVDRYLDIIKLSFDIMKRPIQFERYLDDCWNQSIPKLIDNAIILLNGKSVKIKEE
jgi:hypothetical protein